MEKSNNIFQIYVGSPEDDKLVSVIKTQTVSQVLEENNITISGMIQFNGRTLKSNDLNKTLNALGVHEKDAIHIVRKMDGAKE